MSKYYSVKIDDIFLTKDGMTQAVGSGRCRLEVDGVWALQSDYVKTINVDMRNNPVVQKTLCGTAGRPITIQRQSGDLPWKLPVSVAEDIIELHRAKEITDAAIHLVGTDGDTPDFDVWVLPVAFEFKEFSGFGDYMNPVLRYVTVGETFVMHDSQFVIHGGDSVVYTA